MYHCCEKAYRKECVPTDSTCSFPVPEIFMVSLEVCCLLLIRLAFKAVTASAGTRTPGCNDSVTAEVTEGKSRQETEISPVLLGKFDEILFQGSRSRIQPFVNVDGAVLVRVGPVEDAVQLLFLEEIES